MVGVNISQNGSGTTQGYLFVNKKEGKLALGAFGLVCHYFWLLGYNQVLRESFQ
jgi:hypothetical protein